MTRLVDRHGNEVSQIVLNGQPLFRLRLPPGRSFPDGRNVRDAVSAADLVAVGLDIDSLAAVA